MKVKQLNIYFSLQDIKEYKIRTYNENGYVDVILNNGEEMIGVDTRDFVDDLWKFFIANNN